MKLSQGFWQTYKEAPNDAEIPSHKLMIRAGLIHKSGSGLYNYLTPGLRSIQKVEKVVREELDKIGCHEILMTVVTPGELWQKSGRWDVMGDLMVKFKDKNKRDLCLSPTNEEAVTDIFSKLVNSYKNLPVTVYQINTKFRDEIRPRFGLMRGREFTMKDAYSFHLDKQSLDMVYDDVFKAYENIFKRLGLPTLAVVADGGAMASADSKTHEFHIITDNGEDAIICSEKSGYAANVERAVTKRKPVTAQPKHTNLSEVSTPGKATISEVCKFLNVDECLSLKSLIYSSIVGKESELVMVVLLGDDELNEIKLRQVLKSTHLKPATAKEMQDASLPKGFIGPIGLKSKVRVIFDQSVDSNSFYVVGAMKEDTHYQGFSTKRDIENAEFADLRVARKGDLTVDGKFEVDLKRGIEVGHVFQLGDKYTNAMGVTVLGSNGKPTVPLMGCYGLGVTRVVAAAIERNHDEKGIIWPIAIAPYHVYFLTIGKTQEIKDEAQKIYRKLQDRGIEVLFDDRDANPGVKFKDAELLGLPFVLVLGEREFKNSGGLELKLRRTDKAVIIKGDLVVEKLTKFIQELIRFEDLRFKNETAHVSDELRSLLMIQG